MPGLTNDYISNLGKILCGEKFLGVFPCNIHPSIKNSSCNFSLIFNTDKETEKGEHFVAIFRSKNNFFYFDSFGKKCDNKMIRKFIKNNLRNRQLVSNNKRIQNEKSLFCGLYCISFIQSQNKNISLNDFLKNFSFKNTLSNDIVVTKMITDEF